MGLGSWYIHCLKKYPWRTNLSSATIIMMLGDSVAQGIEFKLENDNNKKIRERYVPLKRRLTLRRYKTLQHQNREEEERQKYASSLLNEHPIIKDLKLFANSFDYKRNAVMGGWALAGVTPFYHQLYKVFDKYLVKSPKGTFIRIVITMVCSLPMNALFLTYSTSAHHLLEEIDRRREVELLTSKTDYIRLFKSIQQDAAIKLNNDLIPLVTNSVMVWTPANAFNFWVVPAHLRTTFLMVGNLFWNTYLSLVQHRDVELIDNNNNDDGDVLNNFVYKSIKKSDEDSKSSAPSTRGVV